MPNLKKKQGRSFPNPPSPRKTTSLSHTINVWYIYIYRPYIYLHFLVGCFSMEKKRVWSKEIIFHQPRFPWDIGVPFPLLNEQLGWKLVFSVAIVWPEKVDKLCTFHDSGCFKPIGRKHDVGITLLDQLLKSLDPQNWRHIEDLNTPASYRFVQTLPLEGPWGSLWWFVLYFIVSFYVAWMIEFFNFWWIHLVIQ